PRRSLRPRRSWRRRADAANRPAFAAADSASPAPVRAFSKNPASVVASSGKDLVEQLEVERVDGGTESRILHSQPADSLFFQRLGRDTLAAVALRGAVHRVA